MNDRSPIAIPVALLTIALLAPLIPRLAPAATAPDRPIVLVVHGGAGTILRENMTPERESEYRAVLAEGLRTGLAILRSGGSSLDAVEATLRLFEDSPLFNAGKGAVFTAAGTNELDASIMDGATLAAGAVAGVTRVRHPISAARAVMEKTQHVMLAGRGADTFAESVGLELVEPEFFFTERRWQALLEVRREEAGGAAAPGAPASPGGGERPHFGTVGAVALDLQGRLAAGTSTGGMTNKRFGRVGDSPIVGAGTYANGSCAVSATGHGEYFIRWAVAYDICARVAYREEPLARAATTVIDDVLRPVGGSGGVIALDREGNLAMPFNTPGMYRGYVRADGVPHVAIYE